MNHILSFFVILSCHALYVSADNLTKEDMPDIKLQFVTKKVYMTIAHGHQILGNVVIGIYGKAAPASTGGFYKLTTSNLYGKTYRNSRFTQFTNTTIKGGPLLCDDDGTTIGIRWSWRDDEPGIPREDVKDPTSLLVSRASYYSGVPCCMFRFSTELKTWNGFGERIIMLGRVLSGKELVMKMFKIPRGSDGYPIIPVWICKCGKGTGPGRSLSDEELLYEKEDLDDDSESSVAGVKSLMIIAFSLILNLAVFLLV